VAEAAAKVLTTAFVFPLIFQLFFSRLIKNIWPLYNLVQLVCHLHVLEMQMPPNTKKILKKI